MKDPTRFLIGVVAVIMLFGGLIALHLWLRWQNAACKRIGHPAEVCDFRYPKSGLF